MGALTGAATAAADCAACPMGVVEWPEGTPTNFGWDFVQYK